MSGSTKASAAKHGCFNLADTTVETLALVLICRRALGFYQRCGE